MAPFFIHFQALTVNKIVPQIFWEKTPTWTAHHTFLESKHPKDIENLHYVLFPQVSQKS